MNASVARSPRGFRFLPLLIILVLCSALAAASCGRRRPSSRSTGDATSTVPRPGGTLRVLLAGEPAPLNPLLGRRGRPVDLWTCFYPSLFTCDSRGAGAPLVRGDLARRSEWSAEAHSLTVWIRTDRLWQDTTRVRASDVVRTYDAYRSMGKLPAGAIPDSLSDPGLAAVSAENDSILHLTFRPGFPLWRAWPVMTWPILPAAKLNDLRASMLEMSPLAREPVSAGPFVLTELRPGASLWLGPNPMAPSGRRPWVRRVAIERSPGPDSRILRVALGRADVAFDVPVFRLGSLVARDVRVQARRGRIADVEMVFWNLGAQNPPPLRRAVSLAIDRAQLVRSLLTWRDESFGGPAGGLLEPAGPDVPDSSLADAPISSFDPAAANRLLDEAGWSERGPDGIRLRGGVPLRIQMIYDRRNELRERIATFLEEDLFRIGILCEPIPLEGSVVWDRFRSGLFDTALLGFRPPIVPDLSDLWRTRGRWNGGGYSSPRADSLIQSLNAAASGEEIERLAQQLEAQVRRDQPVTFLVYRNECDLLSPRVRDFDGTPESPLRGLERVWLADTTEAGPGPQGTGEQAER